MIFLMLRRLLFLPVAFAVGAPAASAAAVSVFDLAKGMRLSIALTYLPRDDRDEAHVTVEDLVDVDLAAHGAPRSETVPMDGEPSLPRRWAP